MKWTTLLIIMLSGSAVLADHFDVVIHFAQTHPSVLLDVEAPEAWAMWDE